MIGTHRDEVHWQRLFEDVEWLLDGNVPVDEVARRCGYASTANLIRAYQRQQRPLHRRLAAEHAHNTRQREANA